MAQEVDYAAVLADLEARRAALDGVIAVLKQLVGTGALEAILVPPTGDKAEGGMARTAAATPSEVAPGMFHGLSVSEAARKFLEMKKAKQRTVDIAAALRQGGIESTAANFYGNVFTTMKRRKDFIKLGKFWALAEWHPTRTPGPTKPPKRGRAGKPRGVKRKRQPSQPAPSGTPTPSEAA